MPTVFPVTTLADSGLGSLRQAILDANGTPGDDTITFEASGTIELSTVLPIARTNIDIQGPGAGSLTVRFVVPPFYYSIITVASAATVGLSGLTRAGDDGGTGIENLGRMRVSDTVVSGCIAGIDNTGILTVHDSVISLNRSGIFNGERGTLTVTDSVIFGNYAFGYGAGIFNGGRLMVSNSTFTNNTAASDGQGGGIFNGPGATAVIRDSTLTNNRVQLGAYYSQGGGIYNGGTLSISNSTLSGNSATGIDGLGTTGDGGGIYNLGTLSISNSTLTRNSAGYGGGIANSGVLSMRNSILAGNTGHDSVVYPSDLGGRLTSSGHNLIGNSRGGLGFDSTDLLDVDPLLGPLQDNGGPTLTHALLPGSPALDAGDNAAAPQTDQRGLPRIVAGTIDIGAFEVQVGAATRLTVGAPGIVSSGVPFDATITALDAYGRVAAGYAGTVSLTTTDADPGVVLPAAYTFTADDQGVHTFAGGFLLVSPGAQALTATDLDGGFQGSLTVQLGTTNRPPALDPIADLSIPASQDTLDVALSATDPDGDPLSFAATAQSLAYVLDQQLGLFSDGELWEGWGGRGERWVQGAGGAWYFSRKRGHR